MKKIIWIFFTIISCDSFAKNSSCFFIPPTRFVELNIYISKSLTNSIITIDEEKIGETSRLGVFKGTITSIKVGQNHNLSIGKEKLSYDFVICAPASLHCSGDNSLKCIIEKREN